MSFSPQITQITQKGNGHKKAQKVQKETKAERQPTTDFPFVLFVPFRG